MSKDTKMHTISIRCDPSTVKILRGLADAEHRSVASVVMVALEEYLTKRQLKKGHTYAKG